MKLWPWSKRPAVSPPMTVEQPATSSGDRGPKSGTSDRLHMGFDPRGPLGGIAGAFGGIGGLGLGAQQQWQQGQWAGQRGGQQRDAFDALRYQQQAFRGNATLESENMRLRLDLAAARNEVERLKKELAKATEGGEFSGLTKTWQEIDWTEEREG